MYNPAVNSAQKHFTQSQPWWQSCVKPNRIGCLCQQEKTASLFTLRDQSLTGSQVFPQGGCCLAFTTMSSSQSTPQPPLTHTHTHAAPSLSIKAGAERGSRRQHWAFISIHSVQPQDEYILVKDTHMDLEQSDIFITVNVFTHNVFLPCKSARKCATPHAQITAENHMSIYLLILKYI